MLLQQRLPLRERLVKRPALMGPLAAQHPRACKIGGLTVRGFKTGGRPCVVLPLVQLQRRLAVVMPDACGEGTGVGGFQDVGRLDGPVPFVRALLQGQQGQTGGGLKTGAFQLPEAFLGPVEQAGPQEILRQGMTCPVTFAIWHARAGEQVLVHADGPLELAATPEQAAQGEVQVHRVGVVLDGLDEGVDGLVLLLVEQQAQALEVGSRRIAVFFPRLSQIQARRHPPQREGGGQRQQQPGEIKVHHAEAH